MSRRNSVGRAVSFSKLLLDQDLWSLARDECSPASPENIRLHYHRARSLFQASGLSINDIRDLTPEFWQFHFDLIATRDMTAFIICTIHLNLCIGTLTSYSATRPDVSNLLDDLLSFKTCGEFMLTEIGHGLDARNIETTATLLPNGGFDLHSPNPSSWKAMPPTTPQCRIPRVAVVFARLVIDSEDHGVKPFIVKLCSSEQMCEGITSRVLPTRPGTKPLDHSITSFNHVLLPHAALLGSKSKPKCPRVDFLRQIWRVSVGTLSLSIMGVSSMKVASTIGLIYSQRRVTTAGSDGRQLPILHFSTQKRPIVKGLVSSIVLTAFAKWTIDQFMNPTSSDAVRHGLATVLKATVTKEAGLLSELSERCGWQGLFAFNQISELALTFKGNSIAEGDTLVLCIRLASELLGDKYSLPEPRDPASTLAARERGLFGEAKSQIGDIGGYQDHRKTGFDKHILPRCRALVKAIGDRMAYEAARDFGVHPVILRLYECESIASDLSWFTENTSLTRSTFFGLLSDAYESAFPVVQEIAKSDGAVDYITAPITSDNLWSNFMGKLRSFERSPRPTKSNMLSNL